MLNSFDFYMVMPNSIRLTHLCRRCISWRRRRFTGLVNVIILLFLIQYREKWELILPAESFRPSEYTSLSSFLELAFRAELSANPRRHSFVNELAVYNSLQREEEPLPIFNHLPTDKISIAYTPNFCDSSPGRKRHLQQHQRR